MDKINIIWIEDNPLQGAIYVADFVRRDKSLSNQFPSNLGEYRIPAIHFESRELMDYHKYFQLQVLQHPVEIKEFVSMSLQLEDRRGVRAFMDLETVLPEAIIFDYHFSEGLNINRSGSAMNYDTTLSSIRKFINPNFRFLEKFPEEFGKQRLLLEQPESADFTDDQFLGLISRLSDGDQLKKKDQDDLEEDDFGLFAAIEILRIFREHPVVGIPATFNKNEIEKLSLHGKYFEWLNEYDYSIDFARQGRGSKKWDTILKDAAKALQRKIEAHSHLRKVTFDLVELLQLASGKVPAEEADRGLTIKSIYGKKRLPLDGLFIDVPKAQRDEAIADWTKRIFHEAFHNSRSRLDMSIIETAKTYTDTLWSAYQGDRFWDRLNFSKLQKLIDDGGHLHEDFRRQYDDYRSGKVKGFEVRINNRGSAGAMEYLNSVELKNLIGRPRSKYSEDDKLILTWTVLFVILKIYKARMDFCRKVRSKISLLPDGNEILTILFPLSASPIVMPVHGTHDNTAKEFVNDIFVFRKGESKKGFDDLMVAGSDYFEEPQQYLLRCYAESIGLTNPEYQPEWIKIDNHEWE